MLFIFSERLFFHQEYSGRTFWCERECGASAKVEQTPVVKNVISHSIVSLLLMYVVVDLRCLLTTLFNLNSKIQ